MTHRIPGSTLLAVSQIIFMVCGYAMHITITRLLGPEEYGTWGILVELLIWFELSVMLGFPKWTTRTIAEETDPAKINQIKSISIIGQGAIALFLGVLFYALAVPFAAALNDTNLELLIKISAFDIPFYGMYFLNLGIINGQRNYFRMFVLTVLYAVCKLSFVVILLLLGFGLEGAAIGNILSSVLVFLLSCFWIGRLSLQFKGGYKLSDFFSFGIPTTVFILGFALLQRVDFLFLKALSPQKDVIGYYMLAFLLAKVPYFIVEATSKSLFSEISNKHGASDMKACNKIMNDYIGGTILLFTLISVITLSSTRELILLMFPDVFENSVPFLQILIISNLFIGFSYLLSQVLFTFDKEKLALVLIGGVLLCSIPLNIYLITSMGPIGAAYASTLSFALITLLITLAIRNTVDLQFPFKLLMKLATASVITCLFSLNYHPISSLGYLLKLTSGTIIFIACLLILRETMVYSVVQKLPGYPYLKR